MKSSYLCQYQPHKTQNPKTQKKLPQKTKKKQKFCAELRREIKIGLFYAELGKGVAIATI